ncbi:hypothetical protein PghCCS26_46610 [Paenibacillus glycanilyticus]|uniref:HTH cro/C1-type domain-containing protein n=2 Tax=Paenibacillus glycanilyticus TaxID=126569 RepID=A0ABQ6NR14_9BACL|nr:hypothetical protein PghCCS26_46610 [Paenibacillus glycanilyticus]
MTQTDFAKRMNISNTMVSKIINNEKIFSLVRCKQAAVILDCKIDDLYEWIIGDEL